ncbi:TonB-dependent siderophore receptor [Acanthopleuribacter pedis]|uniref:TonB-dependent siderophore receptor n=1 Tax=Acanthopleuribacter pedis TaxID=442870 RepID=A0A8J7QFK9_9BACT|nr:TonB-dependent siderophore receptor [Acanthopleuribacter pedis]MBO1323194.1 TonB-dependent siderophore receptor [Acanthopleuribacter pedis]
MLRYILAVLLVLLMVPTFWAQEPQQQAEAEPDQADLDQVLEDLVVFGPDDLKLIADDAAGALKIETSLMETPLSVSVLTGQRLRDFNAQTVQDTLVYTAGVHAGAFGVDPRGDWSSIRGASPTIFVDGMQSLFGNYNNTRPNTFSLSQVEILKGPSSVIYGQGSTGGVINLVSKRPKAQTSRELWVSYGSFSRKQANVDFTGPLTENGKLLYRLVATAKDSDSQTDYVPDNALLVAPSITWLPTESSALTVLLNYQENESGTGTQFLPWEGTILPSPHGQIDTGVFLSEPDWDSYDSDQTALTLMFDQKFNDTWKFHARTRYADSAADYNSMWPSFPPTFLEDGRSVVRTAYVSDAASEVLVGDVQLKGRFESGLVKSNILVGFDFQEATTDNDFFYGYAQGGIIDVFDPVYGNVPTNTPVTDFPETNTTQRGLYLSGHFKFDERWIVTTGLRYDETDSEVDGSGQNQKDDAVTGRLGLMYTASNGVAPYMSFSQSFLPVIGVGGDGQPYEPREGDQIEAGVKLQPKNGRGLLTVAAFSISDKNNLTPDLQNPQLRIQTGEIEIEGFELEGQLSWRQMSFLAAYAYTDAEIAAANDGSEGNHVATIPDQTASLWTTYRPSFAPGLSLGGGVRYVGPSWDGAERFQAPSYTLADIQLGYTYRSINLSLDVDNLTDKEYLSSVLARGDSFYGARRNISASIRYLF